MWPKARLVFVLVIFFCLLFLQVDGKGGRGGGGGGRGGGRGGSRGGARGGGNGSSYSGGQGSSVGGGIIIAIWLGVMVVAFFFSCGLSLCIRRCSKKTSSLPSHHSPVHSSSGRLKPVIGNPTPTRPKKANVNFVQKGDTQAVNGNVWTTPYSGTHEIGTSVHNNNGDTKGSIKESANGYIQNDLTTQTSNVHSVAVFVESPAVKTSTSTINSGLKYI